MSTDCATYERALARSDPAQVYEAPIAGRHALKTRVVAAAIACCLILQLHLVWVQPINWDEFRFLADVHAHARGELSAALLTFQVHLFGWLIGLGNEIDQIRAARLVMLTLEAGTLFLIWTIARLYFAPAAALLAPLGYVSFSFVLQHGASFRFDPILTFLVISSLALLLRKRLQWLEMALVGFLLALAAMVTVKVALALPLVAAVGAYRLMGAPDRQDAFMRLALAAVSSLLFLAFLYAWHLSTLSGATTGGAQDHLAASYTKTLADVPFFPRLNYFLRALVENPLHWLLLLLGISAVLGSYGKNRTRALLLLAFLLPLLTIVVYRNAFPYFYAFALAPASLFFAAAASRQELRSLIAPVALLMTGGAFVHHQLALSDAAQDQWRTVEAVHAIFPEPVSYIDRSSMIASFPQAGLFLSSWWIENYIAAGRPVMRDIVLSAQPVFVIANSPLLIDALESDRGTPPSPQLFEQDRETLRSNYIRHWGPLWVAGKELLVREAPARTEFLVAGEYSLESRGPVRLDGRTVSPGESIFIGRGAHSIGSASGQQRIVLRWGASLPRPEAGAPRELGFGRF